MNERVACAAPLWRWTSPKAPTAWHFVSISGAAGEALSATALMRKLEGGGRGFGSLNVTVTIGMSRWKTSVFLSREAGWMLPVKAAVRKAEGLEEGAVVELLLEF